VIIAKLDRLTRSVKDLSELLERFQRRGVALVSVAESLDTGSAAGRLAAVSQWEREAIGERTRDALQHMRANGERVGNVAYHYRPAGAPAAVRDQVGMDHMRRPSRLDRVVAFDRLFLFSIQRLYRAVQVHHPGMFQQWLVGLTQVLLQPLAGVFRGGLLEGAAGRVSSPCASPTIPGFTPSPRSPLMWA
jgi:hypothetical protein